MIVMKLTFIIPQINWTFALVDAIKQSEDGDTIVVDTLARQELVIRAAARMGKNVIVVVDFVSYQLAEAHNETA